VTYSQTINIVEYSTISSWQEKPIFDPIFVRKFSFFCLAHPVFQLQRVRKVAGSAAREKKPPSNPVVKNTGKTPFICKQKKAVFEIYS
jgi:hypothetical protein